MFFIIDAARCGIETVQSLKLLNATCSSLYLSNNEEYLADFAPYLFAFDKKSDAFNLVEEKGKENSWGIFANSDASFEILYKHFRKFLIVKTEDGKQLYFRFYDPRVLRIFLPTCNSNQLTEFFGPVKQFIMEDENPEFVLRFWLENGLLKQDKSEASTFFAEKDANQNSPRLSNLNTKAESPSKSNPWLD